MRVRLRRRGGALYNPYVAAGRTNAREHNLGRKNEEPLAQQRALEIIPSNRAQKYRSAIGELIESLLLCVGLENDNVANFVFAHAIDLGFSRLTVAAEATTAYGERAPAKLGFRSLRSARA